MTILRLIYLGLAVLGAVIPMWHFWPFLAEHGLDLDAMIAAWKVSAATTALYYDLLIAAFALNIWILAETYARRDYWVLLCLPATYLVGLSFGLPLFLFLRSRPVR